jgi:hypothetical protein
MSEVINFGEIQPSSAMGMRSSDRLRAQPNADATQMERAMMIAQKRDDFQTQGTQTATTFSFSKFSDEQIIDRAKAIGVSMGNDLKSRLLAAKLIKNTEKERCLTFLNNSSNQMKSLITYRCV